MKCSICNGAGKLLNDAVCQECKGDGIAPTPRVNCSGCGTPHPEHETARGMCVRCLGKELDTLRRVIADPAAVWVNMLRGTIARPAALDHYEELKSEVEMMKNRTCEWRETGTWWACSGCDPNPKSITLMYQTYCPGCGGRIEIKRGAKG